MGTILMEPVAAQEMPDGFPANTHEEMMNLISERLSYFRRIALYRLDNAADAEDAVQSAFLSAWKNLEKFRGQAQMSTWLTAIVMNSARLVVRKRPRFPHLPLDDQDDTGSRVSELLADAKPDPEAQVRRSELEHRLRRLSLHLSPNLHKVFRMRDIEGMSVRETADALGLSESAVKTRSVRAREELRRLDKSQPARIVGPTVSLQVRYRRRVKPHGCTSSEPGGCMVAEPIQASCSVRSKRPAGPPQARSRRVGSGRGPQGSPGSLANS